MLRKERSKLRESKRQIVESQRAFLYFNSVVTVAARTCLLSRCKHYCEPPSALCVARTCLDSFSSAATRLLLEAVTCFTAQDSHQSSFQTARSPSSSCLPLPNATSKTLASAGTEARIFSANIDANAAAAVFGRRGHTPDYALAMHHQCCRKQSIVVPGDCLLTAESASIHCKIKE